MLPVQPIKTTHKHVALVCVFEAFVEAGAPLKRSIGFGRFDPTGTVVDRLLAVLPNAPAGPTPKRAASHGPDKSPVSMNETEPPMEGTAKRPVVADLREVSPNLQPSRSALL